MVDVVVKLSFWDESIKTAPDDIRKRAFQVLQHGFKAEQGNVGFLIESIQYNGIKELNPEPPVGV